MSIGLRHLEHNHWTFNLYIIDGNLQSCSKCPINNTELLRGGPLRATKCHYMIPGPCLTTSTWQCRKNFSQWERSFHWKLRCHRLEFLWQHQIHWKYYKTHFHHSADEIKIFQELKGQYHEKPIPESMMTQLPATYMRYKISMSWRRATMT